jgi:hypothetical protein
MLPAVFCLDRHSGGGVKISSTEGAQRETVMRAELDLLDRSIW